MEVLIRSLCQEPSTTGGGKRQRFDVWETLESVSWGFTVSRKSARPIRQQFRGAKRIVGENDVRECNTFAVETLWSNWNHVAKQVTKNRRGRKIEMWLMCLIVVKLLLKQFCPRPCAVSVGFSVLILMRMCVFLLCLLCDTLLWLRVTLTCVWENSGQEGLLNMLWTFWVHNQCFLCDDHPFSNSFSDVERAQFSMATGLGGRRVTTHVWRCLEQEMEWVRKKKGARRKVRCERVIALKVNGQMTSVFGETTCSSRVSLRITFCTLTGMPIADELSEHAKKSSTRRLYAKGRLCAQRYDKFFSN